MFTCCGFKCSAVALSYQPNYNYLLPYSSRPCARERSVYEVQICLLLSPITFYISRVYVRIIYTRIHNTLQRYNFFFECANIFYRNFGFSVFLPIIPSRFDFASIFLHHFYVLSSFFFSPFSFRPQKRTFLWRTGETGGPGKEIVFIAYTKKNVERTLTYWFAYKRRKTKFFLAIYLHMSEIFRNFAP